MLKTVLLATAVAFAGPALAQEAGQEVSPAETQPATPVDTTPAPEGGAVEPAPEPSPTPATEPQASTAGTPAAQPASPDQVASIVDQEFPSYDKDADGNLKPEEFGAWMVALRSATEPAFTGQSDADKAWIGQALAQADADKSGGVSVAELKGFLAPQPA